MVDLVNGGSSGYETGSTFSAKSTNIASYRAIQAGWNEITARLDLMDASNKDIQVVIKKESEILATAWTPASIEAQARAEINEDTMDVSDLTPLLVSEASRVQLPLQHTPLATCLSTSCGV